MRFSHLFIAASALAISCVAGWRVTNEADIYSAFGANLTPSNKYNSPLPPWKKGAKPGWYYGSKPSAFPDIPCFNGAFCKVLERFPHSLQCPKEKPSPLPNYVYFPTFKNLTGATQADDYLTFGLVDTEEDCKTMCNNVAGCNFINAYHDVNGKGGSTQLTCSLFSKCHDASTADNRGGQSQPDGSIDHITDSDGFCKNGQKVSDSH